MAAPSAFEEVFNETHSILNTYQWVCEPCTNTSDNSTADDGGPGISPVLQILNITSYVFICLFGLVGNGLVIYVVLRFSNMKTVTNLYILNLAVSDVLFLTSLPFLVTTTIVEYWVFGRAMCKIYFVFFSINFFTSVLTLTAMSVDRYLAVCHPVSSVKYRTTRIAFFVCVSIWSVSFLIMLPIILYATTVENMKYPGKETCSINWPDDQWIPPGQAFVWYTFLLGFAIPVSLISVFYVSVIFRLRRLGPSKKSKERKKSNRKVTRMVLAMISVYVVCWLPHWIFQVNLSFRSPDAPRLPPWQIYLYSAFTVLSFANSMINPLLYAFLSEIFRKSFLKAFKCARYIDSRSSMVADNSIFPRSTTRKENGKNDKYEFTSMVNQTENTCVHANNATPLVNMDGKGEACETEDEALAGEKEASKIYVDKEIQTKYAEKSVDI